MRPWWAEAVVYEIYVRSFADADGDGIGDLDGVRAHLDHVRELGVDAIWLTPFYPTADRDAGYDVIDHRAVDPRLGTLDGFDALLRRVHDEGLKLIVDLVLNHVSSEHPWFKQGRREHFHVRRGHGDRPPSNWQSLFGGPAWTRLGDGDTWYLHMFDPGQPDLNYGHPEVLRDAERTLRFWLDRGVDGLRFDAAGSIVKADGYPDTALGWRAGDPAPFADQPGAHDVYRRWSRVLADYPGDRLGVAESWGQAKDLSPYVRPDELHQAFAMQPLFWPLTADAWRTGVDELLAATTPHGRLPTWVHGNHDVSRAATRWGLDGSRMMLLLMLALPGSVYLYAGDELGLPDVPLGLPDKRLAARIPLPWKQSPPPYGFGPDGAATWLPQPAGWGRFAFSPKLLPAALALRKHAWHGPLTWLDAPPGVLAFRRDTGWECVANFGAGPVSWRGQAVASRSTAWVSPNGLGIESSSSLV